MCGSTNSSVIPAVYCAASRWARERCGRGAWQEPRRNGPRLIAPLRIGLRQAGVPVLLNTALTDLYVEDGVVRGIFVRDTTAGESAEPQLIKARRGVILGCGGFEHNEAMRRKYQREPIGTEWTVGAVANTGDGIVAAEKNRRCFEPAEGRLVGSDGAPEGRTVVRCRNAIRPDR